LKAMILAEHAALVGLAFFLPLYEAPKNILWLAFVVLWLANRFRARDFGGRWDGWDTLIALWIASGYAAAAFAGIHGDEHRKALRDKNHARRASRAPGRKPQSS